MRARPAWRSASTMGSAPRNLLIVEGTDDHFINQILLRYGFRKSPQADRRNFIVDRRGDPEENAIRIHECNGFDNISRALKMELQPETLDGVAIIADMDVHRDRRWDSLRGTLADRSYSGLPAELPHQGLIHSQSEMPSLGVWLMPDNASEGMMETFASALVPTEDACWAHARATVVELPDTARRFDVDRCVDKASLHTWLAAGRVGLPDRIGGVAKPTAGGCGVCHNIGRLDRTMAVGEFREPVTVQPVAGLGRCAKKDRR
jgi:hypothetical protein